MAAKSETVGTLTKEYIGKYPDMPRKTLARLMRKQHPKVFSSIERARGMIRYYTGKTGDRHRNNLADRRFLLPAPTKDNPLSLPESKSIEWLPYVIPDDIESLLILADVHVPYHDVAALQAALNYGIEKKVDCIVLNGDFADCYGLSRYEKNPEMRDFPAEREAVVHALMAIRNAFPKAKIIYKEGNHEARFGALLVSKAPDLYGMAEFRLDVIFDMFNLGIDFVDMKRPIRYRELDILHGHEMPTKSGGVNPARTTLLKTRSCAIVSHFHRKTNDLQKTLRGELLQAWSTGCLCELTPQYMPINDWVHGFAYIEGGKNWKVNNLAIIDGDIV